MKSRFLVYLLVGFAAGAAIARTASGQAGPGVGAVADTSVSAADRKFFAAAAQGGIGEVELGRLAAEKGSSAEVKAFGQHMVDDHTKVNASLKALASKKGVTLSPDAGADNRKLAARLAKLSGTTFDQEYMKAMVQDHVEDIAEFQKQAKSANDPELRAFASKNLPTLKHHLEMAQAYPKSS